MVFFRSILNESTIQSFHLLQHFLIVITQSVENVTKTLDEVFKVVMNVGLLYVNVLIEDENWTWTLHLYKPYVRSCYTFEIIKISTFTVKNYTNELHLPFSRLYPTQRSKFPGCPLIVSTFPFEPFVTIENFGNGMANYSGLDVKIVNEISKTLNLNPIYMQSSDKKNRGLIFKNGTVTGAMKMVRINKNNFL